MPVFDAERFAAWSGGRWDPCAPASILGVSNNTRDLAPGALYVAIAGERFDGHTFVADAFEKGAAGAMIADASELRGTDAQPLLRVEDTVSALGLIARAYRRQVGAVAIGVTGSVGKTTVKEMTATILAQAMPTARTRGNWNNEIGLPLSVLAMEDDSRVGVFELGMNHPGEIGSLCDVLEPQWGVITTIGPVHIEFFDSVEAIACEKAALLDALPADGHVVLCKDDPYFDLLRGHVGCQLHTVSLSEAADYTVNFTPTSARLDIAETENGKGLSISWPWPGTHNAVNAGLAVAVAREMGLAWDVIERGLNAYLPLPMRWEVVDANDLKIVNDAYNANPLSMRAAIGAFEEMPVAGSKWLVLGDMQELGKHAEHEHFSLGAFVASGPWQGLVAVGALGEVIAAGACRCGFAESQIWTCETNAGAVSVLKREMRSGDAVLLKASRGVALEEVVNGLRE
jgi:UDP-N-acetylmuramoyl-tripeptide--D-alanyl-D-alanine ligase